jgi:hypothetical protein
MKPEPAKVARSLVIYNSITLLAPLALAIVPPGQGAWWILKIFGGLFALIFVGTFISRAVFYRGLLGDAYAGFLLVIALYTIALCLRDSTISLIFYAIAIFFHFGLAPGITKHIKKQRAEEATNDSE